MRERPPAAALVLAALGAALLVLPLVGLLVRAPWGSLVGDLTSREARAALRISAVTSIMATVVAAIVGVPLAWALARGRIPAARLVRALVVLPMVLPPVVGGVALLETLGRRGVVGQWLDRWLDLRIAFTTSGAIIAAVFVAMPFLVVTAEAAFRGLDRRYEEAARTLGAGRWTTFWRVTVPLTGPALAAGAVLCWARALGEFGATITFAGNVPGRTQTLALAIFLDLESGAPERAVALSVLLLVVSLAVLVALRDRWLGAA